MFRVAAASRSNPHQQCSKHKNTTANEFMVCPKIKRKPVLAAPEKLRGKNSQPYKGYRYWNNELR